jgi:hypothetical protein
MHEMQPAPELGKKELTDDADWISATTPAILVISDKDRVFCKF